MKELAKKLEKRKEYLWLNRTHSVDRYVGSEYYDKLLKEYVFQEKSDLEHFRRYLKELPILDNALELGAGNGRATQIFLDTTQCEKLTLIDLSSDMLNGARKRFQDKSIDYVQSDIISYISRLQGKFDFIFTLWSFSHSVHQHLERMGLRKGRWMIKNTIKKMVRENMNKGSKFYLVHFDSLSDEQRILLKQWKREIPIFRYANIQSPSKRYIDESLGDLQKKGLIVFDVKHYTGRAIEYTSMDEALEIFMNFHLESFFNARKVTNAVLQDIKNYLERFRKPNGKIYVKPGCFIYSVTKII